ncbi:MAG: hypothetical protein F6J86_41425 [Symploca sp. SIO1B1]|nr:hypothetical protein [Symploca sp. SIO1B1]
MGVPLGGDGLLPDHQAIAPRPLSDRSPTIKRSLPDHQAITPRPSSNHFAIQERWPKYTCLPGSR